MRTLLTIAIALHLTACAGFKAADGLTTLGPLNAGGAIVTSPQIRLAAPATGMVGVPVNVTLTSNVTLMNARYDFGDGSIGGDASHTYAQPGTFTIRLITDDAALTASTQIQILAYDNSTSTCINDLALNLPFTIIVGQSANLAVSVPGCLSGAVTAATWDLGDGTTASGLNVAHVFPALGTYTIDVTLTSSLGDLHLTKDVVVVSATVTPPTGSRDPGEEPVDVSSKGGWNPTGNSLCWGYAEYGARVDCVSYAFCSGTACGAQDGAVATCHYTYNQGLMDWRLQPGTWEWWSSNMDHPAKGWGCVVNGIDPHLNSAVFNAEYYLKTNPDVKAAIGNAQFPAKEAKEHWMTYGMAEGRQASAGFHAPAYLARYADLRAAFGANGYAQAVEHYVTYGIREGRTGL